MAGGRKEFRPYAMVARQDMAAFLFRLTKAAGRGDTDDSWQASEESKARFCDVSRFASDNHHDEVMWLAERRVSEGFLLSPASPSERYPKARFAGMEPIARCDMAAFLTRMGDLPGTEEW